MLPDKAIEEFRQIYIKKVKKPLSFEEAKIKAEKFIRLFDLITKPLKKDV